MNPSTEDFIKAVEQVNARNIIILPNNKNIFMAAQSAAEVLEQPAGCHRNAYNSARSDKLACL